MTTPQRKAQLARATALLKSRSFDIKFDLENTDYKRIENIGTGAYGVVCSAIHKKTGDRVAIKKIPGVFDIHVTAMRTYREIKILKHFNHDNIISILDILKPKESMDTFKDIYVVLDLMESDLHRIIHSNQDLTDEHIRYFLFQLLRGVKYIHSANVIHRDLKPSNLLVNEDCQLKIGDFGMARGTSSSGDEKNVFMTQYVATRWYRAPEIMLTVSKYTSAVDIWSVGCIFAEMLGRKHLFPGTDSLNQLKLIIGVLGSPSKSFLDFMQSEVFKIFVTEWGHKEPLPLVTLFPRANRKALDLLSKMLTLHPKERLTAEEALKHPYLSKYHDPEDEPICIPAFNFDFEKQPDLKGDKLRQAIIREIYDYHQSMQLTPTFNAVLKPVSAGQNSSVVIGGKSAQGQGPLTSGQGQATQVQGQATGLQAFLNQLSQEQSSLETQKTGKSPGCNTAINSSTSLHVPGVNQVFKAPGQVPVKAEAKPLQTLDLPSSRDVEMLSARSTDMKITKSVLSNVPHPQAKEQTTTTCTTSKENICDKAEHKTISEDTKASLSALLNAKKQRAENGGGDKPEPNKRVTAMSRQKERMQKRKEKAERAKRKEKLKEKASAKQGIELSAADKELLERWKVMQENRPPGGSNKDRTTPSEPQVTERSNCDLTAELPNQKHRDSQGSLPSPLQQQNQQAGPHLQDGMLETVAQEKANAIQVANFQQGQTVFYRADNINKKQPEMRKSFPLDALNAIGYSTGHVTGSQDPRANQNIRFSSGLEMTENTHKGMDQRVGNAMMKRNSTGSAALTQEVTSRVGSASVWRDGSHRCSDPVLSGYGSPSGSPHTSQSESESTPSQGLSPLAVCDESVYNPAVSSPEGAGYMFQNAPLRQQFALHTSNFVPLENNTCSASTQDTVPMFGTQPTGENMHPHPTAATSSTAPQTNSPPQLNINPSPSEVTDQDMPSANRHNSVAMGTSRTSLRVQTSLPNHPASTADWVALLSKQLSKHQVEDIYPPALIGTPKGLGGGYGVGLSLDQEMAEGCSNPDSAPLSASLLADWMDVSGNMSAREMEDLFREAELASPMAISLSDFNLPSS